MGRSRIVKVLGSMVFAALVAAVLPPASAQADGATTTSSPRRLPFKRVHFPGEPIAPAAAKAGALTYHGGPVISSAQIVAVMWGATSATQSTFANGFFPAVMDSAYIDALSEYSTVGQTKGTNQTVVRGSFVGAKPITPSVTGTTIDDTQIGPELLSQIGANKLPAPTYDKEGYCNTLYVIFFAPGITVTQGGGSSCVSGGFCGYHGSTTYNSKSLPYAVIPDMGPGSGCDTGCAAKGAPETDALGGTVSHEVSEAVTDEGVAENSIAWYDDTDNGEIGDICDTGGSNLPGVGGTGTINGFTVQYEYSDSKGACELTNPSIGPQGGCTTNADCMAPTPVCLVAKSTCVQCAANSDCSGAKPICDTTANTCRACTGSSDCSGATPVCVIGGSPDAGVHEGGAADPHAGECVQCTTNAQCTTATMPICKSDTCTGCSSDSDCTDPANPTCTTSTGKCGPKPASSSSSGGGSGGGSGGSSSGSGSGGGGLLEDGGSSAGNGASPSPSNFQSDPAPASSCACGMAGAPASSGLGFAGLLLGLAAFVGRGRKRD